MRWSSPPALCRRQRHPQPQAPLPPSFIRSRRTSPSTTSPTPFLHQRGVGDLSRSSISREGAGERASAERSEQEPEDLAIHNLPSSLPPSASVRGACRLRTVHATTSRDCGRHRKQSLLRVEDNLAGERGGTRGLRRTATSGLLLPPNSLILNCFPHLPVLYGRHEVLFMCLL
ncbi:uncharacterized protein [Zea mays]|uniref:uncharacterized protein n=1 Tax=Zea mays TaxID=4577 RepID=UPI0009A9BE47|nr:uncharacterized protein LOC109943283 [Zea mays]|eukprot:XP_020401785.1 uncharacterized protein LOC109943283 [Zea mays]